MAKRLKSWSQYSVRWRKARLKEGLNPRRWNRYRQLSDKTRANTDPYEYAKGVSVRDQAHNRLLDSVAAKLHTIALQYTQRKFGAKGFKPASLATIRYRLSSLSNRELSKMDRMAPLKLYDYVTQTNRKFIDEKGMSPTFYHAGGVQ